MNLLWTMLYPARLYIRRAPWHRGKLFLVRHLLRPALPDAGTFTVAVPGGASVELAYTEELGVSAMVWGAFEGPEMNWLHARPVPEGVAVDVGANVGVYTCMLARTSGIKKVWAFEPLPENVRRLRANAERNALSNVTVFECALGSREATTAMRLADDGAYASIVEVPASRDAKQTVPVAVRTLDAVWRGEGCPRVSVMKIDVEGAELQVLEGSRELLRTCRPMLLIEANTARDRAAIAGFLEPFGYSGSRPRGFQPWNHVFRAEGS